MKDRSDLFLLGTPTHNPPAGWNSLDGLLPISYSKRTDPKFEPKLLTMRGLKKFLNGPDGQGLLALEPTDYVSEGGVVTLDHRVGIGINSQSLTTIKGELYGIGLQSFAPQYGLYIEVALPESLASLLNDLPFCLGGEGRYVRAVKVAPQDWPPFKSDQRASMWYLATPTFLSPRNIPNPPLPQGDGLRAGASGSGQAVSGWDSMRNGPRQTRFSIPPGAVYFYEVAGDQRGFLESGPEHSALIQEGWGFALQGNWSNDK